MIIIAGMKSCKMLQFWMSDHHLKELQIKSKNDYIFSHMIYFVGIVHSFAKCFRTVDVNAPGEMIGYIETKCKLIVVLRN